jgi:hypothetical protein
MVEFENGPTSMMIIMMMTMTMTMTTTTTMRMMTAVGPTYQGRMGTTHERRKVTNSARDGLRTQEPEFLM